MSRTMHHSVGIDVTRTAGRLCLALLTVTGYGLWYVAGETSRETWSILHWAPGLAFPLLLVWHIRCGRRHRQQQPER